jgi:stearoyl-CoA desaturase (delta-9 desaturase)
MKTHSPRDQHPKTTPSRDGALDLAVKTLSPSTHRIESAIALAVVLIPFAGAGVAAAFAWRHGVSLGDLLLCAGFYALTMFGLTAGFHRLFSHKSFEAAPALRAALAVLGSLALQGPVIRWVADHRRHHQFSDQDGDPHSPHLSYGEGFLAYWRGLWHSHLGWFFSRQKTVVRRFAPDLLKDPVLRRIDDLYLVWIVATLALPALLGGLIHASAAGMLSGFVWGGLVRLFLVHHVTWSVNSLCHSFGTRDFATTDESRNNALIALLAFGEGWHNNHHALPWSARHGLKRFQIDISYLCIRALEWLGLVRDVKVVKDERPPRKPNAPGEPPRSGTGDEPRPGALRRLTSYLRASMIIVAALPSGLLVFLTLCLCKRFRREDLLTRLHCMTAWARFCVRYILRAEVDVAGAEHLPRSSKGCLYIANHQSVADSLVLIPVIKSVAFLSSDRVRKIPVIGACAHAGGSVFVDRSSVEDRTRALIETIRMCKESTAVLVFPEGRVSPDGRLLEKVFFSTLYRAYAEGLRVIPIGLHGTAGVVPYSMDEIRTGRTVAIRIGQALSPADAADREAFAEACWQRVGELHGLACAAVAAREVELEMPAAVAPPATALSLSR